MVLRRSLLLPVAVLLPLTEARVQGQFGTKGVKKEPEAKFKPPSVKKKRTMEPEQCPAGTVAAPKFFDKLPHHHFHVDGCGPKNKPVDESFGLWICCNRHDVCYSSCGTTHKYCEDEFKKCIDEVCIGGHLQKEDQSRCERLAAGFYAMGQTMGKKFHEQGQNQGCDCFDDESKALDRYRDFVGDIYKRLPEGEKKDQDFVSGVMEKYQGQEGVAVHETMMEVAPKVKDLVWKQGKVSVNFNIEHITTKEKKPKLVHDEM